MASLLGVDYPFLDAAYRPQPQQEDTGGQSFMKAYQFAQQQRLQNRQLALQEAEFAMRQKVESQNLQLNAIKISDAIRSRDDQIQAQGALAVFADRIRRAQILGASEPVAQKGVTDWLADNRGMLSLPAGKSLWEDYLKSVDEDRRNKAALEAIRARGETAIDLAGIRSDQATGLEEKRQENRIELEKMREQLRKDLSVGTGRVTRAQFINRQIHGYAGSAALGETEAEKQIRYQTAADTLGKLYDQVLQEHQAAPPTTIPKPAAPAPTAASRIRVRGKDGKTYTVPESQRQQAIDEGYTPVD